MHAKLSFLVIIGFVSGMGQIASDLYLPSLPAMTTAFASNNHVLQLTIAVFMLGFSVSQLIYGPLSDAIGRRKPIIFGLCLTVLGSLCCWQATSIWQLFLGRFLQGVGAGAGSALARATLRDLVEKEQLAQANSHLAMFMVLILTLSPLVGGYIEHYAYWEYNFALLTLMAALVLLFYFKMVPESAKHLHPENFTIKVFLRNAKSILSHLTFIRYATCSFATYAGILCWLTSTPMLLQNIVGLTAEQFGWTYVASGLGFITGIIINAKYVTRFSIDSMITLGISLQFFAGLLTVVGFGLGYLNTLVVVLPISIYMIGTSMVFPNASSGALTPFPKQAGLAAAFFGSSQVFGGVISSSMISAIHDHNQLPIGIGFLLVAILSWTVFSGLRNPQ